MIYIVALTSGLDKMGGVMAKAHSSSPGFAKTPSFGMGVNGLENLLSQLTADAFDTGDILHRRSFQGLHATKFP